MVEDKQLIRQYAAERSEPAFAELVRRHLKMVYAAALRQVNGDTHLAEDVAQTVFADFARKAKTLQHSGSVAGWLFVSTRFAAANAVRTEARRRAREQEVVALNEINPNAHDGWNELRPLIDEALGELGETDRESIVLRYFQGYEFSLVGAALGVSENAARMRVDRALEKLRVVLQKRGLATTGAALGAALADSTGAAVPAQLAATITSTALAQTALSAASATPSILKLLAMNKLAGTTIALAALSLATVLIVRNLAEPEPRLDVATTPAAMKAASGQSAEPGTLADSAANSDAFQKTVQGHDAQVRARQAHATNDGRAQWDKLVAEFHNSAKEEPGVTKYQANLKAALAPGQSLVTSGWRTAGGNSAVIFVTPQVNPDGTNPDEVLIGSKLIEAPDGALDRAGFGTFKAQADSGNQVMEIPSDTVDAMFDAIRTNAAGNEIVTILSQPAVLQKLGMVSSMSCGAPGIVNGKQQDLGTKFGFFPNQSADGNLVLEMMIQSTSATAGETAPGAGQ